MSAAVAIMAAYLALSASRISRLGLSDQSREDRRLVAESVARNGAESEQLSEEEHDDG